MVKSTIDQETLFYQIALILIDKVGPIISKRLIEKCGSAEGVFKESKRSLRALEGIGDALSRSISLSDVFKLAEAEVKFIEDNNIGVHYFKDSSYPNRLRHCSDSPILLFSKGQFSFNTSKVLSIIGTRKASSKGKEFTSNLIYELSKHDVTIVSGLALGIDIAAHEAAYESGLQTIGVLGHGLDMVYPALHKEKAKKYECNGGVISDFPSFTKPDKDRFPRRNRIVAGLSDATIVVESKIKGGSMITAEIASSYNRDVFAVPGAPNYLNSQGCNKLIKLNKAALIESANDLEYMLGWQKVSEKSVIQKKMFVELSEIDEKILNCIEYHGTISIDKLLMSLNLVMSALSVNLLQLELNGLIVSLPGKLYKLS